MIHGTESYVYKYLLNVWNRRIRDLRLPRLDISGNAQGTEAASYHFIGIACFDYKLACRPGLPAGVAFCSGDLGNSHRFRPDTRFHPNTRCRPMDELFSDGCTSSGAYSTCLR